MKENDPRFKTFQDFYVDILGGIIPGLLFLISIIVSIGVPFMYIFLYLNKSFLISEGDANTATKIDLLLSNIFQGWFWVIAFLTLVILAYVIGHIFYRMDINNPDGKDFHRLRKTNLKKIAKEAPEIKDNKAYIYVSQPTNTNKSFKLTFSTDCLKDNKEFIYFFFKLMSEIQNIVCNYEILDEEKNQSKESQDKNILKYFFGEELIMLIKEWNEYIENMIVINKNKPEITLKEFLDEIFNEKEKEEWKQFFFLFSQITGIKLDPLKSKDISSYDVSNANYSDKLYTNPVFLALKKFVLPEYDKSIKEEYSKIFGKEEKGKKDTYKNEFKILYSILFQQSENACDIVENCKFPYMSYYKYILKRGYINLAKHAKWHISGLRTKNRINDYKLYIQTHNPQFYSILTKNESHIRMASSSWFVASILRRVIIVSTIAFFIIIILISYNDMSFQLGLFNINNEMIKSILKHSLILILPIMNLSLLSFLRSTVLKFIHYQRLREVFHTIKLYDICIDLNKNESKSNRNADSTLASR